MAPPPSETPTPTEGDQPRSQKDEITKAPTPSEANQAGTGTGKEEGTQAPAPTEGDQPGSQEQQNLRDASDSSGKPYGNTMKDGRTLKGMMKDKIEQAEKGGKNRTMLGDPTSLKAETTDRKDDPVDHDNGPEGQKGSSQRKSKL
ncbi:MAG: hypothetical protein LQ340_003834 [Diploschistes diacapsis]|nr:MAG: hypothetical protein LQ340_003834 [Diploschistes diacapsis]